MVEQASKWRMWHPLVFFFVLSEGLLKNLPDNNYLKEFYEHIQNDYLCRKLLKWLNSQSITFPLKIPLQYRFNSAVGRACWLIFKGQRNPFGEATTTVLTELGKKVLQT